MESGQPMTSVDLHLFKENGNYSGGPRIGRLDVDPGGTTSGEGSDYLLQFGTQRWRPNSDTEQTGQGPSAGDGKSRA